MPLALRVSSVTVPGVTEDMALVHGASRWATERGVWGSMATLLQGMQVMGAEHGDLCTLLGLQVACQSHFHMGTL